MITEKDRYDNLDGLRAYAAIGIVLMHVRANGGYSLNGFIFESLIPSFTDFVFLFMMVSAFSMCCGYYERILNAQITPSEFYIKRLKKVLPFFAFLCALDFILSPSINSMYEIFANLTLCFGLLPNADISVIGVGWFLGLIFVFYFMFPFFCVLLENKRRAWLSFAAAMIFNYLCIVRFDAGRANIVYCAVYFIAGGLIYLYRDDLRRLANRYGVLIAIGIVAATIIYYKSVVKNIPILLWCAVVLVYALRNIKKGISFLNNPITKLLSGVSMEIYLCHMVVFRALELLGVTHMFESDLLSYSVMAVGTIIGAVCVSVIGQHVIEMIKMCIHNIRREKQHG